MLSKPTLITKLLHGLESIILKTGISCLINDYAQYPEAPFQHERI